jgi:hypothetical protein
MSTRCCFILLLILTSCSPPPQQVAGSPAAVADSLLTVDRAFAAAAEDTNVVDGLVAMLASNVVMPAPGGILVRGRDSVGRVLSGNPANLTSRAVWTPVRAGISADGTHGFTMGYMDVIANDSSVIPMKYLSYWVRDAGGWRVRAFKRGRRPAGGVPGALFPAALPSRLVPPTEDSATMSRFATELAARERAFSDEARRIGLGPAFAAFGSADAMHLGGPNDTAFVVSAAEIAEGIGAGETGGATISWGADQVIVASSGDLGVNIGYIVPDPDSTGGPSPRFPFFTVWRRNSPSDPWLYVAE